MNKKAFTIIELIVIMVIVAVLVLLAVPYFANYTKEAKFTKLCHDAALLEDACQRYYLDYGDWPRASDTPYTAEQVYTFTQKVYDRTGKVIALEPDGKYYDIDLKKLSKYVRINSAPSNFVLQNPVGTVYILDPRTNTRLTNNSESDSEQKPVAVITMNPDQGVTTSTAIIWDYSQSYDPNGYEIINAEWEGKQEQYTEEGEYTVRLRVQNSQGVWSDWTSITFYVFDASEVVQIATESNHTVVLLRDGTVKAWGYNLNGQLGDGTRTDRDEPVTVVGLNNVKQIDTGYWHTVALLKDGTVKAWGFNKYGQLGDGTDDTRTTPVTVEGLSNVKQVVAESQFTLALLEDGTVKAWGDNRLGQLGDGTTESRYTPITVPGLTNVKQIAAGYEHAVALLEDGTAKIWGNGLTTPTTVEGLSNVKKLTGTNAVIFDDGSAKRIHISNGEIIVETIPELDGLNNIKEIVDGSQHSAALFEDGTVKTWGDNMYGQIGNGKIDRIPIGGGISIGKNYSEPVTVAGLNNVKQIAAGFRHTVVLLEDGTVKAWGDNPYGQLGDGTTTTRPSPVTVIESQNQKPVAVISMTPNQGLTTNTKIIWDYSKSYDPNGYDIINAEWEGKQEQYSREGTYTVRLRVQNSEGVWSNWTSVTFYVFNAKEVVQIAAGKYHTVALLKDGTVRTWGNNDKGQLGNGTKGSDRYIPVTVIGLNNVKQIAAGDYHSVALLNDGTVKTWGDNSNAQLGNGTGKGSNIPVTVESLNNVIQIAAARDYTIALLADGTVKAWGWFVTGEIDTPIAIEGLSNVKQIAIGGMHALALLTDGTVKAWGYNTSGQLGTGTQDNFISTPATVIGLSNVKQITAGFDFSAALLNDGTVRTWGANNYGQLGDGTKTNRTTPVTVVDLSDVEQISANNYHVLALLKDGTVKAWGCNDNGQLGDGTTTNRNTPVTVEGLNNVKQVAAGSCFSVALLEDGTIKAWGNNEYGELGDNTTTNRRTPVDVLGLR